MRVELPQIWALICVHLLSEKRTGPTPNWANSALREARRIVVQRAFLCALEIPRSRISSLLFTQEGGVKMSVLAEFRKAEQQGRDSARSAALVSSNPYADRVDLQSAWLKGYREVWSTVISQSTRENDGSHSR